MVLIYLKYFNETAVFLNSETSLALPVQGLLGKG
jgi:hypothetical protein